MRSLQVWIIQSEHYYRFIITVPNRIISDLLEEALSEVAYDAYLAGFTYDVTNQRRGMQVSVSGYSDKLDVVVGTIMRHIKDLQVDPKKLDVVKEQVGAFIWEDRPHSRMSLHWRRSLARTRTSISGSPAFFRTSLLSGR